MLEARNERLGQLEAVALGRARAGKAPCPRHAHLRSLREHRRDERFDPLAVARVAGHAVGVDGEEQLADARSVAALGEKGVGLHPDRTARKRGDEKLESERKRSAFCAADRKKAPVLDRLARVSGGTPAAVERPAFWDRLAALGREHEAAAHDRAQRQIDDDRIGLRARKSERDGIGAEDGPRPAPRRDGGRRVAERGADAVRLDERREVQSEYAGVAACAHTGKPDSVAPRPRERLGDCTRARFERQRVRIVDETGRSAVDDESRHRRPVRPPARKHRAVERYTGQTVRGKPLRLGGDQVPRRSFGHRPARTRALERVAGETKQHLRAPAHAPILCVTRGDALGSHIEITAADGHRLSAYLAEPAGQARGGVVVVQEIFGVNAHIRSVADSYAAEGYLAVAPAFFDRVRRNYESGYTQAEIETGRHLMQSLDWDQTLRDVEAARVRASAAGAVGIVGYCWGGTVCWVAAARLPGLACAVSYYGGRMPDFAAERPRCPVLCHFGEQDTMPSPEAARALLARHPEVVGHFYPAGHGFNCDQRPSYHAESARLARGRTLEFLRKYVG